MKRRKIEETPVCEYCGQIVKERVDGGKAIIPWEISSRPTRNVWLHNKCLAPYIRALDDARQPIGPNTSFEEGARA